jgi:hypothetical protein
MNNRHKALVGQPADTDNVNNTSQIPDIFPEPPLTDNCKGEPSHGDYIYEITTGPNQTTHLTFIPNKNGVGENIVILYYGFHENGIYPGFIITPYQPYPINITDEDQEIYFYYTYSIPEGGEKNTMNEPHIILSEECKVN